MSTVPKTLQQGDPLLSGIQMIPMGGGVSVPIDSPLNQSNPINNPVSNPVVPAENPIVAYNPSTWDPSYGTQPVKNPYSSLEPTQPTYDRPFTTVNDSATAAAPANPFDACTNNQVSAIYIQQAGASTNPPKFINIVAKFASNNLTFCIGGMSACVSPHTERIKPYGTQIYSGYSYMSPQLSDANIAKLNATQNITIFGLTTDNKMFRCEVPVSK